MRKQCLNVIIISFGPCTKTSEVAATNNFVSLNVNYTVYIYMAATTFNNYKHFESEFVV